MNINFGKEENSKNHKVTTLLEAGYEEMMKLRKEQLPRFEKEIQEAFKDYNGESFAIIMMKEDENGKPSGSHVIMAGVSGLLTQVALSKKLDDMSSQLMEVIIDTAKGNTEALITIAKAISQMANAEETEK